MPASVVPAEIDAAVLRVHPRLGREIAIYGRPGSEPLIASLADAARALPLLPLPTRTS